MIPRGRKDATDYILERIESTINAMKIDVRDSLAVMVPRGEYRIEMETVKKALDEMNKRLENIEHNMVTHETLDRIEKRFENGPVSEWVWRCLSIFLGLGALIVSIVWRHG